MAVIGKIVVGLTANTAQFYKDMNRARGHTRNFAKGIKTLTTNIAALSAGMTAGSAMALKLWSSYLGMVTERLGEIDKTGKLSRRLGMSSEALIAMRHAAKLAGASTESLDKSLDMMNRNLVTMAATGGKDVKVLKAMGIDLNELIGMRPEAAFMKIADTVKAIKDPMTKTYVATRIFGRSGAELITMLDGGSAALRQADAECRRLGISFSDLATQQAAAANDAMTRLDGTWTGMKNTVAVLTAPLLTDLAKALTEVSSKEGGLSLLAKAFLSIEMGIRGALAAAGKGMEAISAPGRGLSWLHQNLPGKGLRESIMPKWMTTEAGAPADFFRRFSEDVMARGVRNVRNAYKANAPGAKLGEGGAKAVGGLPGIIAELNKPKPRMMRADTEFRQVASLARLATGVARPQDQQLSLLERIAVGVENTADAVGSLGLE